MTKKELTDQVTKLMAHSMESLASDGGFRQRAVIVDRRGKHHLIMIADGVLHGPRMREMLMAYSLSVGGAEAVIVASDMCFAAIDPKTPEGREYEKRIRDAAEKGRYIIAEDPNAQEALLCCGRAREHQALLVAKYTRRKREDGPDEIVYAPAAPEALERMENNLIPDLWERVN